LGRVVERRRVAGCRSPDDELGTQRRVGADRDGIFQTSDSARIDWNGNDFPRVASEGDQPAVSVGKKRDQVEGIAGERRKRNENGEKVSPAPHDVFHILSVTAAAVTGGRASAVG